MLFDSFADCMKAIYFPFAARFFLFCFLSFSSTLFAQSIIHVENRRMAATDNGLSGTIELSANFIQNINDIFQTANAAQIQYVKDKWSFLSLSMYNLTVFNRSNIVNEGFTHLRAVKTLNKKLALEGFVQGQFNEIIKIKYRHLVGTGLRIKLFDRDSLRFFSGSIVMGENEMEATGILNNHLRLSQYFSVAFPIKQLINIDLIAYFQPDLLHLNDFRTSAEAIVDFKLTRKLQFRLVHSLFYDSKPPETIRNTFYNFRNGLIYRF